MKSANNLLLPPALAALLACSLPASVQALGENEAIALNNKGVVALNKGDFVTGIERFEKALTKNATYKQAWQNLSVAYNNQALAWQKDVQRALKSAHKAVFYDPQSATARQNLKELITSSGKDPEKAEHLIALGDQALAAGDGVGALVDFQLAAKLTNDDSVKDRLDKATKAVGKLAENRRTVFGTSEEGDW